MNIKLAIADENEEYIERLLNVLKDYDDLSISAYTDKKNLKKALSEKNFDVLLFDMSVYEGQVSLGKTSLGIMLLDETEDIPVGYKDFPKIKKYQRINKIYKRILELYADKCGNAGILSDQKRSKAIAFYSPIGGAGKTTVALATAARLALMGYKTFYLNLEDIASEAFYLPQTGEKGISEMLSCLGADINFQMKLQGLMQVRDENLFYLNHFDTPNDLYELDSEEIEELVCSILKTGLFDYLLIDMGNSLDEKAVKIFEVADHVLIIEKTDAVGVGKLETFFRQTYIMKEYGKKMKGLLNFDIGRTNVFEGRIFQIGRINMVQNPDAGQFITMLSESNMSDFVKAFLE